MSKVLFLTLFFSFSSYDASAAGCSYGYSRAPDGGCLPTKLIVALSESKENIGMDLLGVLKEICDGEPHTDIQNVYLAQTFRSLISDNDLEIKNYLKCDN